MDEFMRYFIILLILCINSNSFAHFSLKQHEIIHYYPSIEKEYLDINVKNDDQLVKVAAIVQRIIAAENKGGSDDEFGLSDKEKEQLMGAIEDAATDLQQHSDEITDDMKRIEN